MKTQSYTVWFNDWTESDGKHYHASSEAEAAETFCRRWDWDTVEFDVAKAGEAVVLVRDDRSGKLEEYRVEARQEIVYTAYPVEAQR